MRKGLMIAVLAMVVTAIFAVVMGAAILLLR
jgi:hypothetical protein